MEYHAFGIASAPSLTVPKHSFSRYCSHLIISHTHLNTEVDLAMIVYNMMTIAYSLLQNTGSQASKTSEVQRVNIYARSLESSVNRKYGPAGVRNGITV